MNPIDFIDNFLSKDKPKNYLYTIAALASLLFVVLLLPSKPEQSAAQVQIVVSATPISNQLESQDLSLAANDEPIESASIEAKQINIPAENPSVAITSTTTAVTPAASTTTTAVELSSAAAEQTQPSPEPLWQDIEVQSGDSGSTIFSQVGLSDQELFRVLNSSDEAKVLNRLYPGYQLNFKIPAPGQLEQLRVLSSPLQGHLFTRQGDNYTVETILRDAVITPTFKRGTISGSLFVAGQREKIPAATIMEMANIFGGVIDFILDPRSGDEFSILYEEKYLDGVFIGNGDILASSFTNQGKQYTAIRYIDEDGRSGYYNPNGESMRKAFLRSPLDVFRISSDFNPRRRHPILNTIRAHKGTDYAAPRGTPIMATSDGQITWATRNGSFGNLVIIKHTGGFETKYAHLSSYARNIKKGARVSQGDIIGYVGTTGSATGPHLHYEFLVSGVHKNPRTILDQLPKAVSIEASQMDRFHQQTDALLQSFKELNDTRLLSLNQQGAE